MKILCKWPTRSRPTLFLSALKRYRETIADRKNVHFVITYDEDDRSMDLVPKTSISMEEFLDTVPNLKYRAGQSKTKIEACNADISDLAPPDWDIVVLASDDQIPMVRGWDAIISADMARYFPDLDGSLWYNDGHLGGAKLCTLTIWGRKYYERFGYLYHPDYRSTHCDDEAQAVAQSLGKLQYIPRTIIKHEWMNVTGRDALHARNSTDALYKRDEATLALRRARGFPKESVLEAV